LKIFEYEQDIKLYAVVSHPEDNNLFITQLQHGEKMIKKLLKGIKEEEKEQKDRCKMWVDVSEQDL